MENKIANLIHELKDVDLSGGELFQSIKLNEAEIISVTNLLNSSKQLEKGVIKMLAFDKKISNFSAKIFLLMDSMSRIASYSTRLSSFLTLYKNITVSQKTERNSDLFGINVLRTLHIWYSSSYSDTDYLYLIFMFAIEYAKFSSSQDPILKIHASHWYFFLNGEVSVKTGKKFLADEFPINPSPQYIRKDCWERILALSRLPEFSKFAMEFVRYANRATTPPTESSWEDVFQSVDPLQSSFPDRWENQLNKFEKLLVIQCLRPDALCIFIKDYITIAIGKEFLEPVLEILPYQIPASISMTCLVLSNTHDSIVYDIRRLASQRRIENFLTFLVLGRDDDKKIFEVIEDSISKGKWVVCQECQDDIKMTCKIWNRLKQLESGAFFNSNFRIWLLSQPCDSYPLLLYSNAHRIFVSKTDKCFFANLVSRIIPILEENLAPHEFDSTVTYRGLLLKLVIFYLVCNYRNSYVPLSIFHSRTFNESDLKVSIKMLRTMFKENTPNSIEKDLSSRWMSIFGELAFSSQIGDSWDKRNLNSLFEDFTMLDFASDHAFTNAKAFKKILDMMNRNESKSFNQTLELFNDALDFFGLNANAQQVYLKMQSQNVYQSIKFFNSSQVKIQKQSIWANFENVNSIATKFVSQINNLTFKTVLDLKTSFVEPIVDLHYRFKHMDKVLIDNINRYRNLSRQITSDLDHLSFCLYNGLDDVSISICNQIIENVVPTEWKFNMYKTRASFSDFIDDLISRFEFIIEWFNSRFGSYSTIFKGLVSYKIGYLFNPKSFVYGIF